MTFDFNTEDIDTYNKAITSTNLFGIENDYFNEIVKGFSNYKNDISYINDVYDKLNLLETNNGIDNKLYNEEIKKKREIQINAYYIHKYYKQINILKEIIFFCCLGLIGFILFNMKILSETILVSYIGILLSLLFIKVMYDLWDIYIRDDRYFNEYNFKIYGTGVKTDSNKDDLVLYKPLEETNLTKKCIKKT